jgi:hypothetical protein
MAIYYTVDRSSFFSEGMQLALLKDFSRVYKVSIQGVFSIEDLIARTLAMYPEGISPHGQMYLFNQNLIIKYPNGSPANFVPADPIKEAIFELIRRSEFPDKPSRMQSMFAWQTMDEALNFIQNYGNNQNCRIFEIESDSGVVLDMGLLLLGGQVMGAYELARRYWSGEIVPGHASEVLIPLPTRVGREITL